jgi:hypothetical protein
MGAMAFTPSFCPSCGIRLGSEANFCDGCGYNLNAPSVPSASSQAGTDATFQANFTKCLASKGFPNGVIDTAAYATPAAAIATLALLSKQVVTFMVKERAQEMAKEEAVALVASQAIPVLGEVVDAGIAASLMWMTYVEVRDHLYEKMPAVYAVFDCARRVGIKVSDLPYGPEAMNLMNHYLWPPVMLTPPPTPVVLPPPPANWSPAVIPMEDPAPATPKPPSGNIPWPQQILVTIGVLILVGMVMLIGYGVIKQGGFNGGGGTWYMHYNCGGDSTCIGLSNGANTGIIGSNGSQGECQSAMVPFQRTGIAPSYWCDQSSDPAEAS